MPKIRLTDDVTGESAVIDWQGKEPPSSDQARDIIDEQIRRRIESREKIKATEESLSLGQRALAAIPTPVAKGISALEPIAPMAKEAAVGMFRNFLPSLGQLGRGVVNMARPVTAGVPMGTAPTREQLGQIVETRAGHLADILEGGFGVAAPVATVAKPLQAAKALVPFAAGAYGGEKLGEALDLSPNVRRLTTLATGGVAAGLGAKFDVNLKFPKFAKPKPPISTPTPQGSQVAPTSVPSPGAVTSPSTSQPTVPAASTSTAKTNVLLNRIWATAKPAGLDDITLHKYVESVTGKTSLKDLDSKEVASLVRDIRQGKVAALAKAVSPPIATAIEAPTPPVSPPIPGAVAPETSAVTPPVETITPEVQPVAPIVAAQQPLVETAQPPAPLKPVSSIAEQALRRIRKPQEVMPTEEPKIETTTPRQTGQQEAMVQPSELVEKPTVQPTKEQPSPPKIKTEGVWSRPREGNKVFKQTTPEGKVTFTAETKGEIKGEFKTQEEAVSSFGEQPLAKTAKVTKEEKISDIKADEVIVSKNGTFDVTSVHDGEVFYVFTDKAGNESASHLSIAEFRRLKSAAEKQQLPPEKKISIPPKDVVKRAELPKVAAPGGTSTRIAELQRRSIKYRDEGNMKAMEDTEHEIKILQKQLKSVYAPKKVKPPEMLVEERAAKERIEGKERGGFSIKRRSREDRVGSWITPEGKIITLKSNENHFDPTVLKQIGTTEPFENKWTRVSGSNIEAAQKAIGTKGFDTAVQRTVDSAKAQGRQFISVDITHGEGRVAGIVNINQTGNFLENPVKFLRAKHYELPKRVFQKEGERGSVVLERKQKARRQFMGEGSWHFPDGERVELGAEARHWNKGRFRGKTPNNLLDEGAIRTRGNGIEYRASADPALVRSAAKFAARSADVLYVDGPKGSKIYEVAELEAADWNFDKVRPMITGEEGSFSNRREKEVAHAKERLKQIGGTFIDIRSRIEREKGPGKYIMQLIDRASDVGEVNTGQRMSKIRDANLHKLTDDQAVELVGALQGKRQPTSDIVKENVKVIKEVFNEIADEAEASGLKTRLRSGKYREFQRRPDFYSRRMLTPDQIADPKQRELAVKNLMENHGYKTRERAESHLDEWANFIKSGERSQILIDEMIKKNPELTESQAAAYLRRFRKRGIKRQGSLEHAREINLPFYDADPRFIIPDYVHSASMRTAEVTYLGQKQENLNYLIDQVEKAGGNVDLVQKGVDRILKFASEASDEATSVLRLLRTAQGFKLSPTSSVKNVIQGTWNSMFKADIPTALYGFKQMWTKQGRKLALQSGASIDAVIQESMRHAGSSSKILGKYLRAIGFTGTERLNRVVAANAGWKYADVLLNQIKRPQKPYHINTRDYAYRALTELLGENPSEVVARGNFTDFEKLLIAKRFSDLTQFRSRPQDWPELASTEVGKVLFQFKSYIYGQSKLMTKQFATELKNKNFKRATRDFVVLASIFPLGGEATRQLTNYATGKTEKLDRIEKWWHDALQVGAFGAVGDAITSGGYRRGAEWIAGPTVGEAGEMINLAGQKGKGIAKYATRRLPGVGPFVSRRLFPEKKRVALPHVRPILQATQ